MAVFYLLLGRGVISLSEVGVPIALFFTTATFAVLWWGWGPRIERWLQKSTISEEPTKIIEQELTQLVSPLYAKLNKNDKIVDFMTTYKISGIWSYDDPTRSDLEKLEEDIKEIMLQHGHLASDQLYNLIRTFQKLVVYVSN